MKKKRFLTNHTLRRYDTGTNLESENDDQIQKSERILTSSSKKAKSRMSLEQKSFTMTYEVGRTLDRNVSLDTNLNQVKVVKEV